MNDSSAAKATENAAFDAEENSADLADPSTTGTILQEDAAVAPAQEEIRENGHVDGKTVTFTV